MDKRFLKKHDYKIGFLSGILAIASMTSERIGVDDATVYFLPAEDTLKEFSSFFRLRMELHRDDCGTLEEIVYDWFGNEGSDKELSDNILFLLKRYVGTPKDVYSVVERKEAIDKLEGPKGYGPFFFISDFFFVEYDEYTLVFFMGNDE